MPHDGDSRMIDILIGLQIVQCSHCAPGTGGNYSPFVSFWETLTLWIEKFVYPIPKINLVMSDEVLVIDGTQSIPLLDKFPKWPSVLEFTRPEKCFSKIVTRGVLKTMFQKAGDRFASLVGNEQDYVHRHPSIFITQMNLDVFSCCGGVHELRVAASHFKFDSDWG